MDNKTIILLIIAILLVLVCFSSSGKESFSPYRNTGKYGSSKYLHLDSYDKSQCYENNPRIYPVDSSYITKYYDKKRNFVPGKCY